MRSLKPLFKANAMQAARRVSCVFMAFVLLIQPVSSAAAAEDTGVDPDADFHYVAIGDSVAAGFDLDTNTVFQNSLAYLPQLNNRYFSDYCYPSLAAEGMEPILVKHGVLKEGASVECTNFGFPAFKVETFIELIDNPDYTTDLGFIRNSYINAFIPEKEIYDSLEGQAKAEYLAERKDYDHDSLKELLTACYDDDDPYNNQSSALLELSIRYGLIWNTAEGFRSWYEENAAKDDLYESWFNDWYDTYIADYYPELIHGEKAKLHDIFFENIADADLISLDIGSNNMLYNYLMQTFLDSMGTDAQAAIDEETGLTYYLNLHNPLSFVISNTFGAVVTGGDSDAALDRIPTLLRIYRDEIDLEDVTETLKYYSYDVMKATMLSYIDGAMEQMPELADKIEEINHSDGKNADIMCISRYAAMGNSIEIDRNIAALYTVMKITMNEVKRVLFDRDTAASDDKDSAAKIPNEAADPENDASDANVPADIEEHAVQAANSKKTKSAASAKSDPDPDDSIDEDPDSPSIIDEALISSDTYTEDELLAGIRSYDRALEELQTISDTDDYTAYFGTDADNAYSETDADNAYSETDADEQLYNDENSEETVGRDAAGAKDDNSYGLDSMTGDDSKATQAEEEVRYASYSIIPDRKVITKAAAPINSIIRARYEAKVSELIDEMVENLRYNIIYLLFGRVIKDVIIEYNERLRAFADERGYIYVDIYDIPNDTRLDPHPMSDGHRYIADQIIAAADKLYASKGEQGEQSKPSGEAPESQDKDGDDKDDQGENQQTADKNFISDYVARMNSIRKLLSQGKRVIQRHMNLSRSILYLNDMDTDNPILAKSWSDTIR